MPTPTPTSPQLYMQAGSVSSCVKISIAATCQPKPRVELSRAQCGQVCKPQTDGEGTCNVYAHPYSPKNMLHNMHQMRLSWNIQSVSRSLQGICQSHKKLSSHRWRVERHQNKNKEEKWLHNYWLRTWPEIRSPKAISALTLAMTTFQTVSRAEDNNAAGCKAAEPGYVSACSAVTSFRSNYGC